MRALAAARLRWRTALSALLPLLTAGSTLAAPLPGGFAHSGWYEFEIIVLADTRSETLESETWPMATSVAYPTRWRWLQDPTTMTSLAEAYPEAHIAASSSGHLSVRLPQSPAPSWTAPEGLLTEGDLSLIDELIQLGEGTDTSAYRLSLETLSPATTDSEVEANEPDAPGPVLPFEEVTPAVPATPLTALESLGITEPSSSNVAIPFAAPTVLPELLPVTVSARAIPMPQPFIRQPLAQLADGLTRYRRNNDDELIASASWLQGPGSEGLPILLEPDIESDYPSVQGFIQLLPRGNTWRLGINFWANTPGQYLPDFFDMPPPPPSPHRIAIIEAMPDVWSLTRTRCPTPIYPRRRHEVRDGRRRHERRGGDAWVPANQTARGCRDWIGIPINAANADCAGRRSTDPASTGMALAACDPCRGHRAVGREPASLLRPPRHQSHRIMARAQLVRGFCQRQTVAQRI